MSFTFETTRSIRFGAGLLDQLDVIAAPLLGARIVMVTDPGMMATGMPRRADAALRAAGAEVHIFQDVAADPSEQIVNAARDRIRAVDATGVIGLGGGSSLDVAKLAAALAFSGADLRDCYGIGRLSAGRLPLVAVPTTAGTGSEVTPIAIVSTDTNEKFGVVSPVLLPDIAVLDPETTLGLPPHVTAATGIDAMVHAIESYCSASPNNNPVSRALACEALHLMGRSLESAVATPGDVQARSDMLLGSLLAGQAFANSPVAAIHALAYPIGGRFKVSHGLSNALVLPHVLRFNAETAPAGYAHLAPIVFPSLRAADERATAFAFCEALQELSVRCGLQQHLRDVGIPQEALAGMASDAMNQTRLLINNPRKLTQDDALGIYNAAW
ncbi:iron-containing alcohol dehydrogenase [Paracoccus jeotgali]|uniref:Alcohol dehydrogenase 2 n=1 Tax=Paracoccus jeotgali TaxID=2065379 RepID=A0A2K9MJU1_9RHOB|nr:iron-containing alcohol dehydrogenase [Paracoccus jeotgali]AUM75752.1 alcohol dehydrogenase [Paracoccus jeotgali]